MSIVVGAPFASGLLVVGPTDGATYMYEPASEEILEKTRRIQAVCERFGASLPAAALQFPLGHPRVSSVIPGARSSAEVRANVEAMNEKIDPGLWAALREEGLIRDDAPTPDGAASSSL